MLRLYVLVFVLIANGSTLAFAEEKGVDMTLDGEWVIETAQRRGEDFKQPVGQTVKFNGGKVQILTKRGEEEGTGTYTTNDESDPNQIDMKPDNAPAELVLLGIYKVTVDNIQLCIQSMERPTEFKTSEETGDAVLMKLSRKSKE